jgi:ribonuclease HI
VGSRDEYLCYTDGACKAGDPAPGGWGFSIRPPSGPVIEGHGRELGTLAKVMEYRAVAEALAVLPEGATATVFADNLSLIENLSKKLAIWHAHDFARADPTIVESLRRIHATIADRRLTVRWQWVRGHNGNPGNERADELAALGAREAKAESRGGR